MIVLGVDMGDPKGDMTAVAVMRRTPISEKVLAVLGQVPVTSATVAQWVGEHPPSVATTLTQLHKAGRIRAESIWVKWSKKPVLFYYQDPPEKEDREWLED